MIVDGIIILKLYQLARPITNEFAKCCCIDNGLGINGFSIYGATHVNLLHLEGIF